MALVQDVTIIIMRVIHLEATVLVYSTLVIAVVVTLVVAVIVAVEIGVVTLVVLTKYTDKGKHTHTHKYTSERTLYETLLNALIVIKTGTTFV